MTDRFEEAVRQAAQGLTDGSGGELPGYHQAWQRGRRRRVIKQAGMACAGALVLVTALTVNLGNFGRGTTVEIDDVALPAEAATAVPTTEPVAEPAIVPTEPAATQPLPTLAPTTAAESATQSSPAPAATEPAQTEPTAAPAQAAPAPTPIPTATAAPAPAPTATDVPSAAFSTDPVPTPTSAAETAVRPEPTPTVATTAPTETGPVETDPADTAAQTTEPPVETSRTPGEPEPAATGPAALPNITFIGPNQPADAALLPGGSGEKQACDLDGDDQADATCKLLATYPCVGDGDVRPGYLAIDLDEDGSFDTCAATEITACDTSGDGLADTPCTIELLPEASDDENP